MPTDPKSIASIPDGLAEMQGQSDAILQLALTIMKAGGGNLYLMDMLANGAVKRHVSTATAIEQLITARNMLAARALLRLQIDTALRFSAAWMTDSLDTFAKRVLDGERIDQIKDRDGKYMRDAYLVETHKKAYPWLPEGYDRLSGYVHFSGSHIFAPFTSTGTGAFEVTIGKSDDHYPESSWTEIIGCFLEISGLLIIRLRQWKTMKEAPRAEAPPAPA